MGAQSAYKASIELSFDYKTSEYSNKIERIKIEPERIGYLMIDYHYESENVLPIIYISLKIPVDLNDKIVNTYKTSTFYLKLTKNDNFSASPVSSLAINDVFNYVCSNKEQNTAKSLNDDGLDDNAYISTTIGLVSSKMTAALRKSFNGIYKNITVSSLINDVALDGLSANIIMSPIKYDTELETFIVNPVTTRYKMLTHIFEQNAFYDTLFTFFMDFDNKVYLIDKSGNAISNDGTPDTIYFNITQVDDSRSISPGGTIRNGSYQVYVNATQTKISVNDSVGKIANKIVAYDYSGEYQKLDITDSFLGDDNDKEIYLKTDNAAIYRNEAANNTVLVELYKENIDPTMITPNKAYIVIQNSNYAKYNGHYILSYKKELYAQSGDGEFNLNCTIGLKRINNIELSYAQSNTTSNRNKYGSGAANITSSSDIANATKNYGTTTASRRKTSSSVSGNTSKSTASSSALAAAVKSNNNPRIKTK